MGLEGRSDKEEAQQSWGQEWEDLVVFYSEYIETYRRFLTRGGM